MYLGYRIRIDGVKFPEGMIARGTYTCTPCKRRVLREFYDGNGKKHVIFSKRKTADISFELRKRSAEDNQKAMSFFKDKEECEVVYWDDRAGEYKQGTFKVGEIEFKHSKKRNGALYYEQIKIELEGL